MTDQTDLPDGLADLQLEVRIEREVQNFRDIQEGIARRDVAEAEFDRAYAAHHLDRARQIGREAAARVLG